MSMNVLMNVCMGLKVLRGPISEVSVGPGRCPRMTDEWVVNVAAILTDRPGDPGAVVEVQIRLDEAKRLAGVLDAAIRMVEDLDRERKHLLNKAKWSETGGGA